MDNSKENSSSCESSIKYDSDKCKEDDQMNNIDTDDMDCCPPEDDQLIGDYSRPFILPRVSGRQPDLATISCSVLLHLINGIYDEYISSYKIIDCRYPYEFEGGHIKGAINLYKYKHIFNLIKKAPKLLDNEKPHLLIFYCEFSSSRAPRRLRFLRRVDRENHVYPSLSYPECYILQGGYKTFYLQQRELCVPPEYKIMKDPDSIELYFRYKAKTRNSKIKLFHILGNMPDTRKRSHERKCKAIDYEC